MTQFPVLHNLNHAVAAALLARLKVYGSYISGASFSDT